MPSVHPLSCTEEELRVDGSGKSSPSVMCDDANFVTVMNLREDSDRVGCNIYSTHTHLCLFTKALRPYRDYYLITFPSFYTSLLLHPFGIYIGCVQLEV